MSAFRFERLETYSQESLSAILEIYDDLSKKEREYIAFLLDVVAIVDTAKHVVADISGNDKLSPHDIKTALKKHIPEYDKLSTELAKTQNDWSIRFRNAEREIHSAKTKAVKINNLFKWGGFCGALASGVVASIAPSPLTISFSCASIGTILIGTPLFCIRNYKRAVIEDKMKETPFEELRQEIIITNQKAKHLRAAIKPLLYPGASSSGLYFLDHHKQG